MTDDTIYTDGTHLVAYYPDPLHAFAERIGLKRSWFQDKRLPHYDLTTKRMMYKAINAGAIVVSARNIVMISRELRKNILKGVGSGTKRVIFRDGE